MPPIDPDQFRRLALLLATGTAATACGAASGSAGATARHTDPTMGPNGNAPAPVVEAYATPAAGYCDYATGTYYDPTGEAWWNGGPDGTCYAPTGEGYVDPSGEYYAPVYEG